jgi:DNA (cytosine-5)-methyltransferase 1
MSLSPTKLVNVLDLFAGCGGFTQGFKNFRADPESDSSPFHTVGAVEWDIAAASTYAANFAEEAGGREHIFAGDIKDWTQDMAGPDVDVILGGPPCQGFSGLGKEDPDDPRNQLWREYVRVVKAVNPKLFVIENVDRFFRSHEFNLLEQSTEKNGDLRDYQIVPLVLNAADYGVPQARRRAIVLATHRDLMKLHPENQPLRHPDPTHRKMVKNEDTDTLVGIEEARSPWVPASTIFENTPKSARGTELPNHMCSPLGQELPGTFLTTQLHIGRNPTLHSLTRYAAIPPGGNRHDLPADLSTESWLRHRSGSHDVMGRMYWDQPSVTIRTEFYKPEKGRYLHPSENRPITHMEAALLQGFPKEFKWCGTKVQIARQIGNAVPVGLSHAIARQLYAYLEVTGQVRRAVTPKSA